MDPFIARAQALAGHLPGVVVETYFGAEALKVGGKVIANPCREPGAMSVWCPLELREALIASAPDIYFTTEHFRAWPAVLVRMDVIDDATLAARLEAAWEGRAPRRLVRARRAGASG